MPLTNPLKHVSFLLILLFSFWLNSQTNGPTQVQAFDNTTVTDWVDSGGNFNYTISLIEVPGAPNGPYTFSLSYNSASVSLYGEASEVGLGWNLIGPGKIVRELRGIPDDHNGQIVKEERDFKTNHNITLNVGTGAELFGFTEGEVSFSQGFQFNNFSGLSTTTEIGLNAGFKNVLSAGLKVTGSTYGSSVSPSLGFNYINQNKTFSGGGGLYGNFNSREGLNSLLWKTNASHIVNMAGETFSANSSIGGPLISFGQKVYYPSSKLSLYGLSFSGTFKGGTAASGFFANGSISGSYGFQRLSEKKVETKGYGYLFLHEADETSLMDFYREKDGPIYPNTTHLGMSYATPDIFNVSASGLSGSFRAYRNDLIILHDKKISSKSENYSATAELGFGFGGHVGLNPASSITDSYEGAWKESNKIDDLPGKPSNQNLFYFKMYGEQTLNERQVGNFIESLPADPTDSQEDISTADLNGSYTALLQKFTANVEVKDEFEDLGGANPIRVKTSKISKASPFGAAEATFIDANGDSLPVTKNLNNISPRKVDIQYYTYGQISDTALGKTDYYLNLIQNTKFFHRNENYRVTGYDHIRRRLNLEEEESCIEGCDEIGAFMLTDTHGNRYIFGISTLNFDEEEHAYAIKKRTKNQCEDVSKLGDELDYLQEPNNSTNGFKNIKSLPAYSSSYLLTTILGHNYVDFDMDSTPSNGDFGDYITFTYQLSDDTYEWRTPYKADTGSLVKGNLNDQRLSDDKTHYSTGKKEIWHLTECETKTHKAEFDYSIRKDGKGLNNGGYKGNSFKLKSIKLKTSENDELLKNIVFGYDYSLCEGVPNLDSLSLEITHPHDIKIEDQFIEKGDAIKGLGKLSLRYLGMEYFGHERRDEYQFNYSDVNPHWKLGATNPWGGYRNFDNPCLNVDFPYINQQERDTADYYSEAWLLNEIVTPSKGKINIDFEADDHSYTQNKASMAMFKILDYDYNNQQISIDLLKPISDNNDGNTDDELKEFEKYIKNLGGQLYVKVYVNLKNESDGYFDWVSGYVDIQKNAMGKYDLELASKNNNGEFTKGRIKLKKIDNYDPIRLFAFQRLREQPELIFDTPINMLLDDGDLTAGDVAATVIFQQVILASEVVANLGNGITELLIGFNNQAKLKGWGKPNFSDSSKLSYVRLNLPNGSKIGGGSRVKQITISDNWNSMTSGSEPNLINGFVYDYTLSNGKSSGVATNEPIVIGDENALRRANPFATTDKRRSQLHLFFEEPILESLFPAPTVTYSQINVTDLRSQQILDGRLSSPAYSNLGRIEKKYYTSKDFPTRVSRTDIVNDHITNYSYKFGFGDESERTLIASQGYAISLNGMNGLEKSTSYYRLAANGKGFEEEPYRSQEFIYKSDVKHLANGRKEHDLMNEVLVSAPYKKKPDDYTLDYDVKFDYRIMGREPMDLSIDMRHQKIKTKHLGVQGNVDIIFIPAIVPIPIPVPMVLPSWKKEINDSRVVSTTKINRFNPILDKIVEIDKTKGINRTTRNVVFDEFGNVVLSKTNTPFGDSIFTYQTPAHWRYKKMRPLYESPKNKNLLSQYTGGLRSLSDPFPFGGKLKNAHKKIVEIDSIYLCPNSVQQIPPGYLQAYPNRTVRDIYHKLNVIAKLSGIDAKRKRISKLKIVPVINGSKKWSKLRLRKRKIVLKQNGFFAGLFGSRKKIGFYNESGRALNLENLKIKPESRIIFDSIPSFTVNKRRTSPQRFFRIVTEDPKASSITVITNFNPRSSHKTPPLTLAMELCTTRVKKPMVFRDSILEVWHKSFTKASNFDMRILNYKYLKEPFIEDLENYLYGNAEFKPKLDVGIWKIEKEYEFISDRQQSATFMPRKDGLLHSVLYEDWRKEGFLEEFNWITKSKVSKGNTNGTTLEIKDASDKFETHLLGYNNSLQVATAQGNVKYHEIGYEGFEEYDQNQIIAKKDLAAGNIDFYTESQIEGFTITIPSRFGVNYIGNGLFVAKDAISSQRFSQFINDFRTHYSKHEINSINLNSLAGSFSINPNNVKGVGMTTNGLPVIQIDEGVLPDFCPEVSGDLGEVCFPEVDLELIEYRNPPLGSLDLLWPVDKIGISSREAHTGKNSLKVTDTIRFNQSRISLRKNRWYTLSGWYKIDAANLPLSINNPEFRIEIKGKLLDKSKTHLKIGPSVEDWVKIDLDFTSEEDTEDLAIQLVPANLGEETYPTFFDDLRIHPRDALMVSKVYDKFRRVIAELDENNFASFFGYNGKDLININKETEEGIITINEYRYNTSKK